MLAENDGTLPGMARSEPPELRESIKNNDDNMAPPTKEMLSEFSVEKKGPTDWEMDFSNVKCSRLESK